MSWKCNGRQASRHEVQYGLDLLPSHIELFHHFINGQVLKIFYDGRDR